MTVWWLEITLWKSAYRKEMEQLVAWCKNKNQALTVEDSSDDHKFQECPPRIHLTLHQQTHSGGHQEYQVPQSARYRRPHMNLNITSTYIDLNITSLAKKEHEDLRFLYRLRIASLSPIVFRRFYRGKHDNTVPRRSTEDSQEHQWDHSTIHPRNL